MKSEEEIKDAAFAHAKSHAKEFAQKQIANFQPDETPVSIFMAGSPGAGKTELSLEVIESIFSKSLSLPYVEKEASSEHRQTILRIDADEYRKEFEYYDGSNSHLFQRAASRFVDVVHSAALKKKISFLLDGTLANEDKARENIQRSLKRARAVKLIYVYQAPAIAWQFVKDREVVEGRRIRKEDFADKFCASRSVVDKVKKEFGSKVQLSLAIKDIDNTNKFFHIGIERIGDHLDKTYTPDEILDLIAT